MNTAFYIAQEGEAFSKFPGLCHLQEKNGVILGENYRGKDSGPCRGRSWTPHYVTRMTHAHKKIHSKFLKNWYTYWTLTSVLWALTCWIFTVKPVNYCTRFLSITGNSWSINCCFDVTWRDVITRARMRDSKMALRKIDKTVWKNMENWINFFSPSSFFVFSPS